jgi:hypothetical protein
LKVLINAIGISDSGGISIFSKTLEEVARPNKFNYHIFLFKNNNTDDLFKSYRKYTFLKFHFIKDRGLIFRVIFENFYFYYFVKKNNIDLIYNITGTAQFFSASKQLLKIQNLLFYSKKLDEYYLNNNMQKEWLKHIFIKRLVFKLMLQIGKYIEIQSSHVKDNLKDYLDLKGKVFFIKNDFEVKNISLNNNNVYDFKKKVTFLYIIGPHFNMPHKNIKDFLKAMTVLSQVNNNFEIKITLSKKHLVNSDLWDKRLNNKTKFLGYINKDEIEKQFQNNTILISNSVIETLGLHVIEAISNGILTIVPNENYAKVVYGDDIQTYELFNVKSLINKIDDIYKLPNESISKIITKNKKYLTKNEKNKHLSCISMFNKILKESYV